MGQTEASRQVLLLQGEIVACSHFISRLANNANMYWSKDKCKESIEAFNEDRHNFEYFLQVYVHAMEKRNVDLLQTSTRRFLDDFPQKCMYLEMCLLPSFYILILEGLLTNFDRESQPVHTVELLCLLGHEKRKVTKPIADFYFVHGNNTNLDKSFEHYGEALAMMEKLGVGGHKESILTLKNYGLCHQRKGNYQEAINFLAKANLVSEIELEDVHKWKVMIETQLALLYLNVGRVEEAKLFMKKGLEMCHRLGQSIDQLRLANRADIKIFSKSLSRDN
ncbi:hypothetical protein OS493_038740 [Desmophyllum pertusum]|uniref:Uncharacterized protein n=1 Tax=Desmophyllum pertusum TaxID=174260 RepID=A0A9W9YXC4_9CNID|nr:hypothetical protein OS493_038740 [Desmophyllum pertusum]